MSSRQAGSSPRSRRFSSDNMRTTVEQNIVLRWVSESDLVDLYRELSRIGLAEAGSRDDR